MAPRPEAWLRGPLPGVPSLLQPVAHALLQAREDVDAALLNFPAARLWERPGGVASVGFHLRHLSGVLDRLFTYARGEALNAIQLQVLAGEDVPGTTTPRELADVFHRQVDRALEQLRNTPVDSLGEAREVGRAKLPSTVFGLLVHAAEHAQRHVGQLLVTARLQRGP